MQIKHDSDSHNEEHTSELMSIGLGFHVVGVGKVIGLEHFGGDNLVPIVRINPNRPRVGLTSN
jgi:hypothetical protein